tara:strand:+ start:785 stop:1102 length:318 start_codon:yes stop_codon:yes gene_type:complete
MSKLRTLLAQEGLLKTAKVTLATVKRINEMTDYNDHTGAAIALCEALGMKREAKVMKHVKAIQAIYGSMPYDLGKFRSNSVMPLVYKHAKNLQMPDGRSLYDHLD